MSDQTSSLHDASTASPRRGSAPQLRLGAMVEEWARPLSIAAFVAILLIGGFLRLTHVNWDDNDGPWNSSGSGAISSHLHPDERFLVQIAGDTKGPSSVFNYFDTDTSALSPY